MGYIRKKVKELETKIEVKRQEVAEKDFSKAVDVMSNTSSHEIKAFQMEQEANIALRTRHFEEKLEREKEDLEKEIERTPVPKPRYSKKLIEMRHAEMLLAKTQRFEEAYDVRRTTKVEEEKEYEVVMNKFETKMAGKRESLEERQAFQTRRFDETIKDMQWRLRREVAKKKKNFADTMAFNRRDMGHAMTMELKKVTGEAHNADPPTHRYISKLTNPTCRGIRKLEQVVGKRHLAIPGLAHQHDFKDFP